MGDIDQPPGPKKANYLNLSLSLPRGITEVTGGVGRSEGDEPLGKLVSFFGFLLIFSLRCSLPMVSSCCAVPQGLRLHLFYFADRGLAFGVNLRDGG
jgi:hypothetical protein